MFEIFAPTNIKIPFGLSNFFLRRAGAGGAILFRSAASSGVRSGGLCRVSAGCAGFRRTAGQAVSCGRSRSTSAEAVAGGRRVSAGGGRQDRLCHAAGAGVRRRRLSRAGAGQAGGGRRDRQCHAAGAGARRRRLPRAVAGFRRAAGQAVSCGRSRCTSTEAVAAVAGQAGGNGQPDGGRRVRPATSARERRYPAATCPDGSHAQPAAPDEGAWHASQHPPRGGSNGRGSSR